MPSAVMLRTLLFFLTALTALDVAILPQAHAAALGSRVTATATASARSHGPTGTGIKVPVQRFDRRGRAPGPDELREWAIREKNRVAGKWAGAFDSPDRKRKRAIENGLIGLTDVSKDTYYYANVSIGTPPQQVPLVLDTGSSDLWVATNECQTETCTTLSKYHPSESTTGQRSHQLFSITYGSGAVTGEMAADTVSLGGYSVFSQSFVLASQVAKNTVTPPAAGIMGLGFQALSTAGVTPWWEVLAKEGALPTNAYTFQLTRAPSRDSIPGGIFTLGEIDPWQYSGEIRYAPIPKKYQQYGYWSVMLDTYAVNGGEPQAVDQVACIDTGTTLIATTYDFADRFYASVPGSVSLESLYGEKGLYAFPCNSDVEVTFTFGGIGLPMRAEDFNAGTIDSEGQMCLGAVFGSTNGGSSTPSFIIGDAFLKSWFSVFHYEKQAVGFASLRGDSAMTLSTTTGTASTTATPTTTATTTSTRRVGDQNTAPASWTSINVPAVDATGSKLYWAAGVSAPSASGIAATALAEKLANGACTQAKVTSTVLLAATVPALIAAIALAF